MIFRGQNRREAQAKAAIAAARLTHMVHVLGNWKPVIVRHRGRFLAGMVHHPHPERPYIADIRVSERTMEPLLAKALKRKAQLPLIRCPDAMDVPFTGRIGLVGGRIYGLVAEDSLYGLVRR